MPFAGFTGYYNFNLIAKSVFNFLKISWDDEKIFFFLKALTILRLFSCSVCCPYAIIEKLTLGRWIAIGFWIRINNCYQRHISTINFLLIDLLGIQFSSTGVFNLFYLILGISWQIFIKLLWQFWIRVNTIKTIKFCNNLAIE